MDHGYRANRMVGIGQSIDPTAAVTGWSRPDGSVETQRKPELVCELDRMERAIGGLDVMLDQLAGRLEGALRPPEPGNPVDQVKESCPTSGYASTLHQQSARVSYLADRVQDLLRRLEV